MKIATEIHRSVAAMPRKDAPSICILRRKWSTQLRDLPGIAIIDQQRRVRVTTIQICDHLIDGTYQHLRDALPGISLVQVVHVTGAESIAEAIRVAPHVDALLLETGNG